MYDKTSETRPIQEKIRQLRNGINHYLFRLNSAWLWKIKPSLIHHVKCYAVFWKLPNAIHGTEQLLFAEKLEHQNTSNALKQIEGRLESLIDRCIDELPADATGKKVCSVAAREFYKSFDWEIPEEYLTDDEAWERLEKNYEDTRGMGGIPDDVEIVDALYYGRKLLGVQSKMVLQHPNEEPECQYYKEVLSIKKGGWNVSRNRINASCVGGYNNAY